MIDSADVHYNVQKLLFRSLSYVYVVTVVQIKVSYFFFFFHPTWQQNQEEVS
jgi:hypothetical protein